MREAVSRSQYTSAEHDRRGCEAIATIQIRFHKGLGATSLVYGKWNPIRLHIMPRIKASDSTGISCTTISITDLESNKPATPPPNHQQKQSQHRPTKITSRGTRTVAHLEFIENPVSTSISVNASIVCTPGASAKKLILTLWHVEGFNGLQSRSTISRHPHIH